MECTCHPWRIRNEVYFVSGYLNISVELENGS